MTGIRRRLALPLLAMAAVGVLGACPDERQDAPVAPILAFDTAEVRIASGADTLTVTAELALTDEQRMVGLMERLALGDDAGMLFLYTETQPATASFWMYRTRIPLDIAFLDSAGVIRAIRRMEPCESVVAAGCPTYAAGVPFRAALEMSAGYFAGAGIEVGDRVFLEDVP